MLYRRHLWLVTGENHGFLTRYAHDISARAGGAGERERVPPLLFRRRSRTKRERDLRARDLPGRRLAGAALALFSLVESRPIDRRRRPLLLRHFHPRRKKPPTKREWGEYVVINVRRRSPRVKPRAWCTRASTFDRPLPSTSCLSPSHASRASISWFVARACPNACVS